MIMETLSTQLLGTLPVIFYCDARPIATDARISSQGR